jgi:hypothetical protein
MPLYFAAEIEDLLERHWMIAGHLIALIENAF